MLRAVERQLLTRFKDTTATPLAHLDALLEMTHRQVMALATTIGDLQAHMHARHAALGALTRLLLCLVRLRPPPAAAITDRECLLLTAALSPLVDFFYEQTWEQRIEAALGYLLQVLSKGHGAVSVTGESRWQ
jgi:hypothetical protein